MRGHQVGNQELLLAQPVIDLLILTAKPVIDCYLRLSHLFQHCIGNVLRRNLQLSADMVSAELPKKGLIGIVNQIIKANTRANKNLFHPGQSPKAAQKHNVVGVIHPKIFAGIREETLVIFTNAVAQLLFAGWLAKIGCRPTHVVDIAFKVRLSNDFLGLLKQRLLTSCLDNPPLMKGQGAKVAASKTAASAGEAKAYLLNGRNPAGRLIGGMIGALVGQLIDCIHLLGRKRFAWGVLHDKALTLIRLNESLCRKGVCITILRIKAFGVGSFILFDSGEVREKNPIHHRVGISCTINGAVNIGQLRHGNPCLQGLCHSNNAALTHAVKQKIRRGVQ